MKNCIYCKNIKPAASFSKRTVSKDGLHYYCRECVALTKNIFYKNNPNKSKEYENTRYSKHKKQRLLKNQVYRQTNKQKFSEFDRKKLLKKYGMSIADYDIMLEKQNNRCAGCYTLDTGRYRHFHIDHCHKTNLVRGLLCPKCNMALGLLMDNIDILKNLIIYLTK